MKTLQINENWSIESDDNNSTLKLQEQRIKEKGKGKGEEFTYKDHWYFPNVIMAMEKYILLSQKEAKDVQECIDITNKKFEELKSILNGI